ncbi:MAG: AbrB/MazE/SpoVT family DNA-binding domain-containing protein [Actinomycetota bacterium]|nr:AbrB/MazE/SpoVT family DNA-binding domain-containing protein [Actinomycetota bacterium]
MPSATVTSKGQVTIPVDVRTKLGLRPGSRLAFVPTATGGYEIHPEAASIRDLKGSVPRPSRPVGIEEMDDAIAAAAVTVPVTDAR